jgi:chromosome segregation ATPase
MKSDRAMSRIRVLAYLIAFGLSFNAIELQPGALAQGVDAAQFAQFQSKLEIAQRTQVDLNRRVTCLNQRDTELVSQRDNLEERIGQLRSQEQQLDKTSREQDSAYKGYLLDFEKERSVLDGLRRQLWELESRKRAQEHALQECKAKPFIPNFACDASYGLLELVGEIKNYDGDIAAAARREQNTRERAELALGNLQQSRVELDSTRYQATTVAADISRTEQAISALKIALSDLRDEVQPYQLLIDAFRNALDEAKDVNLADQRPRTLRKLRDIAANFDAAMASSSAAVQHANLVLPAGWMEACIAR